MTDRRERERLEEREDERLEERERRGEQLRGGWRQRHPSEKKGEKGRPGQIEE